MSEVGRGARRPWKIPPKGWKQVLLRVRDEIRADSVGLMAAGVAFYWLLAIFPALVAAISIWGLVADPAEVEDLLETASETMPAQARAVLSDQLRSLVSAPTAALGIGTVLGILTSLWSATNGIRALMGALNVVYEEEERRGFLALNAVALGLLLLGVLTFAVATVGVIVVPAVVSAVGLQGAAAAAAGATRWVLLTVGVLFTLAVLYRYGPSRAAPTWNWASVGAVVATAMWLGGSALFSWYVGRFGSYNETYGSLAGVVILLLWFWLTVWVVLVGGELNAELERQAAGDSARGPPAPTGPEARARGA